MLGQTSSLKRFYTQLGCLGRFAVAGLSVLCGLLIAGLVYQKDWVLAVLRTDAQFSQMRAYIGAALNPAYAAPVQAVQYNLFGQLVQYPGKQVVAPPVAGKRTMVAFVFGQSNAANHGGKTFSAEGLPVFNYWQGQYYAAADPLLGATGNGGSVWTLLAKQLIEQQVYEQVVLIPAAVGGTSVSQWQPGGQLHPMWLSRLQALKQSGVEVTHFLWHQGEADNPLSAHARMNLTAYRQGMLAMIAVAHAYFPHAQFYLAQASHCGDQAPSSPELLAVQAQLVTGEQVRLGPNTDSIGDADRYDDCHFSASGLQKHADGWMKALADAQRERPLTSSDVEAGRD